MNKKIFTLAVLFVMAVCSALSVKAQDFTVKEIKKPSKNKYWIASPGINETTSGEILSFKLDGGDGKLKSLKTSGLASTLMSDAVLWTVGDGKNDAYEFILGDKYLYYNSGTTSYELGASASKMNISINTNQKASGKHNDSPYYIIIGNDGDVIGAIADDDNTATPLAFYARVYAAGNIKTIGTKDGDKTASILIAEANAAATKVTIVIGENCLVNDNGTLTWKSIVDVCNAGQDEVDKATWLWDETTNGCEFKTSDDKWLTVDKNGVFTLTTPASSTADLTTTFLFDRETDYYAIVDASLRGVFAGTEGNAISNGNATSGALLLGELPAVKPLPIVSDLTGQITPKEFEANKYTGYYMLSDDGKSFLTMLNDAAPYALGNLTVDEMTSADIINRALWQVTQTTVGGDITFTFRNRATGELLTAKTDKDAKTVDFDPAVKAENGTAFKSVSNVGYIEKGVQLLIEGLFVMLDPDGKLLSHNAAGSNWVGFYNPPYVPYEAGELLDKFGKDGFPINMYHIKGGDTEVKGSETFGGLLVPSYDTKSTDIYFHLKNGDKFIVLDTLSAWADNNHDLDGKDQKAGAEKENYVRGMKFALVSQDDLDKDIANGSPYRYNSVFKVSYPLVNADDPNEVVIEVYKGHDPTVTTEKTKVGRLYAPNIDNTKYLTVSYTVADPEKWVYVTLGKGKLATDADVIKGKFVNITLVTDKKVAGPTGLATNPSLVQLDMPEGQFSIIRPTVDKNSDVLAPEGTYAFVNRESQKMFTHASTATKALASNTTFRLYKTDTKDEYTLENGETIRLKYIDDTSTSDGYRSFDAAELKDLEFDLAVYSSVMGGNAYLMEKHEDTADHQIGLSKDKSDATIWKLEATDEIVHIIVPVGYLDNKVYKTRPDTLSITPFMVQNKSNNEYVIGKITETGKHFYFCDETPKNSAFAQRFILKSMPDGNHNVVELYYNWKGDVKEWVYIQDVKKMPYAGYMRNGDIVAGKGFYTKEQAWLYNLSDGDLANDVAQKVYGGFSANKGTLSMVDIYDDVENDLIKLTQKEAPEYRTFNEAEVIRIFRHTNSAEVLYEKGEKDASGNVIAVGEFLGLENIHQYKEINPAIYLNYIHTTGNRPEYLLVLNPDSVPGIDEECEIPGHTPIHTMDTLKGRFLTNLIEKANAFDKIHTNKYVNAEGYAKLGFIPGSRVENTIFMPKAADDTKTDEVELATADRRIMKFAFRIVDTDSKAFVIETRYDAYTRVSGLPGNNLGKGNVGYLKWMNGYVVVVDRFEDADIFNSAEDKNPVNNDNLTTTDVKVIGGQGEVIIRNAANKVVTVNNIVGQTIASEVVSSDEATLHVPAGVAIVTVDGKAVKVLVK